MERTVRAGGSERWQVADSLRKSVTNPHGDCHCDSYCYSDSNGDSDSNGNANCDSAASNADGDAYGPAEACSNAETAPDAAAAPIVRKVFGGNSRDKLASSPPEPRVVWRQWRVLM